MSNWLEYDSIFHSLPTVVVPANDGQGSGHPFYYFNGVFVLYFLVWGKVADVLSEEIQALNSHLISLSYSQMDRKELEGKI